MDKECIPHIKTCNSPNLYYKLCSVLFLDKGTVRRYGSHAITCYFTASEITNQRLTWFYSIRIKMAVNILVMHMPKLENHGNTKKSGVTQTNISVFLMKHLLSGESYIRRTPWWQNILNTADNLISIVGIRKCYHFRWKKLPWLKIRRTCHFYFDIHQTFIL